MSGKSDESKAPRASVIVRSKNSSPGIAHVLAALFAQQYDDFDLTVVDSGSTDDTLEVVGRYPHRLQRIEPSEYFPGKVLNGAIEQTTGEILVFLNSDTVPLSPLTLGRLIAAFDDPEVQAAFARQLPRPDADAWVRRDYDVSFPDSPEPPEWITLSLPLAAMRRSAWERHKFYTDAWGSEDTEWGVWARKEGLKVRYVHDACVMHSHNYTLRQLYGRRFIEGEADAFIYREPEGLRDMARRWVLSTLRDLRAVVKAGHWGDLPNIIPRRFVYHWAHLAGHRHGTRRRLEGDPDAGVGQRTVLSRQ